MLVLHLYKNMWVGAKLGPIVELWDPWEYKYNVLQPHCQAVSDLLQVCATLKMQNCWGIVGYLSLMSLYVGIFFNHVFSSIMTILKYTITWRLLSAQSLCWTFILIQIILLFVRARRGISTILHWTMWPLRAWREGSTSVGELWLPQMSTVWCVIPVWSQRGWAVQQNQGCWRGACSCSCEPTAPALPG